jgi:hypothetical protein
LVSTIRISVDSRLVTAAAVCILLFLPLAGARSQPQSPTADKEQPKVEEAADRIIKRFYATLSFETIWKEDVVVSASIRAQEVFLLMLQLTWESKQKIPLADQERAYLAQRNFQMLLSAVKFTAPQTIDRAAFEQELKEPYESLTRIKRPILSAADMEARFTTPMNHLCDILRKYIDPGSYNGTSYQARVAAFTEDAPDEAQHLQKVFQLSSFATGTKIYLARREMFYLYFIKEADTFKLLTISGRLRD